MRAKQPSKIVRNERAVAATRRLLAVNPVGVIASTRTWILDADDLGIDQIEGVEILSDGALSTSTTADKEASPEGETQGKLSLRFDVSWPLWLDGVRVDHALAISVNNGEVRTILPASAEAFRLLGRLERIDDFGDVHRSHRVVAYTLRGDRGKNVLLGIQTLEDEKLFDLGITAEGIGGIDPDGEGRARLFAAGGKAYAIRYDVDANKRVSDRVVIEE